MKKLCLLCLTFLLTSCGLFHVHKLDVDQGNVYSENDIKRLHRGMSAAQVISIMGNPVLKNVFTPNRVEYIYTFKPGSGETKEKRLSLRFNRGFLDEIEYATH